VESYLKERKRFNQSRLILPQSLVNSTEKNIPSCRILKTEKG